MQFSYGGTDYTIHGKHTIAQSFGGNVVRFQAQTVVTGGSSAINTAVSNLSTNFQDFTLTGDAQRKSITNGGAWITRAECAKAGDRLDTHKTATLTFTLTATKAGARFDWGGTDYYVRDGSFSLTKAKNEIAFEGVVVTESASAFSAALSALTTDYQDLTIEDPDGSTQWHTASNGAQWVNTIQARKVGADNDESYSIAVSIRSVKAGYKFTYNSATYRIEGDPQLHVSDETGAFTFTATITDLTAAEAAAAIGALAVNEADFVLKDISDNAVYTLTNSTRTGGMKTRAQAMIVRGFSDETTSVRFTLTAEREPQESGKNGRREAFAVLRTDASGVRTVTLRGTYTGRTTGDAKATYAAEVSTWITSILNDIDSGATWQTRSEQVEYESHKHVLRFTVERQEVVYWATPSNVSDARHGSMTITLMDAPSFGVAPVAGLTFNDAPARVRVETMSDYNGSISTTTAMHTHWREVIRPWIVSSLTAAIGVSGWVFDAPQVSFVGVNTKRILTSQTLTAYGLTGGYVLVDETVMLPEEVGLRFEKIWSGIPHDYDEMDGGPVLEMMHTITLHRRDSEPQAPPPVTGNTWRLVNDTPTQKIVTIDPRGDATREYQYQWQRRYRYVSDDGFGTTVAITPSPLGEPLT